MVDSHLPAPPTPFVGREQELADIQTLLADPACRLLTLVGPGGIGKTRLAIQAADQLPHFAHGVYFVPLQPLSSPTLIPSAIASALNITFYGAEAPAIQLTHYLREKHLLLLLDNFEQVLDGVGLLTDILETAAGVKILVTSRERLNVQEEWALMLDGLAFPDQQATDPLDSYSAVQLFVQRARQVQAHFNLKENAEAVRAICQRLEGMPLGIELAATWLRATSCEQIAEQMAGSLDFLTTPLRNVPERHRSLRAVFEQSWKLLSDDECDVLMKLSVFRGGFDREAAEQVAGATLPILAGLADKSLIRVQASGRYDLHELLRQYAADKLSEAGEAANTANRHLDYFLKLAEQAEAHVYGREQTAWFDRLEVELDNVRAALAWSIDSGATETGLRMAGTLAWFFQYREKGKEGLTWLERMIDLAPDADASVRAKALHRAGEFSAMFGDDAMRTKQLCAEALALAQQANDKWNMAWALASSVHMKPLEHETEAVQEQSLALFREIDDPFGISHLLRRRGLLAINAGDYAYARVLLDEALSRAREVGDVNATAWSLHGLGLVVWLVDADPKRASALFQKSLSAFQEVQNISEACFPLAYLAWIEQTTGNEKHAQTLYDEALVMLQEGQYHDHPTIVIILCGLGKIAAAQGKLQRAARLLAAAHENLAHSFGFSPFIAFEAELAAVRDRRSEAAFAAAWAEGKAMTEEQVVAYALQHEAMPAETTQPQQDSAQTLTEPLSEREREILRLVADGMNSREIAERLVLSVGTIRWYLKQMYSKLDAHSRSEAIACARELKLLS